MKKFPIIFMAVFIVLFGGIILGVAISIFLGGPLRPSDSDAPGNASDWSIGHAPSSASTPPGIPDSSINSSASPPSQASPHPLVGRWELAGTVEIDPVVVDGMATAVEYFRDGSGRAHHENLIVPQIFTWNTESGRLTIIPADVSMSERTYEYEITDDVLTIFYNTNRTSYAEMIIAG